MFGSRGVSVKGTGASHFSRLTEVLVAFDSA